MTQQPLPLALSWVEQYALFCKLYWTKDNRYAPTHWQDEPAGYDADEPSMGHACEQYV